MLWKITIINNPVLNGLGAKSLLIDIVKSGALNYIFTDQAIEL